MQWLSKELLQEAQPYASLVEKILSAMSTGASRSDLALRSTCSPLAVNLKRAVSDPHMLGAQKRPRHSGSGHAHPLTHKVSCNPSMATECGQPLDSNSNPRTSTLTASCVVSTASLVVAPFANNESDFVFNPDEVQGFSSDRSRVLRSPSPLQALSIPEMLFHNMKIYFEDSCQNMILDEHGTLLSPNGAELRNDLCNDFDSYCFTATVFKERNLLNECRHALSKASALVERILRAEHPRALTCFLEVLIHFIQTGAPEIASILRKFIKGMAENVLGGGFPWGQICRLLGELDSDFLDHAMARIWKCTADTFESELGTSNRLAVSVRLDYIKRVYGFQEHLEEERLLRDLLARFNGILRVPTPRVMLNLAHNLNRQGRHDEAERMALEVFLLLQEEGMYAKRISERIECMKVVSHSLFSQGKALEAERTLREAMKMIVEQWGTRHPWLLEFKNVLEGWLRDWGKEEDANTLRREIEELMGYDEIV